MRISFYLLLSFSLIMNNAFAQQGDPKDTEVWEPVPKIVEPGKSNDLPPSDAISLLNGRDLSGWLDKNNQPARWKWENNSMTVVRGTGDIHSEKKFGSCQLHIEWRTPTKVEGEGQGRGNSGIFFMGRYELQVLDSYNNRTYSNGQAGSIYKQHIPLVNASRKPGEWQTYDAIFTAPTFNADGSVNTPARITVFHNGVLIQNNVELKGSTAYIGLPKYTRHAEKESLILQDHGNPVSYRNIWIREL
jgi:hypothetical protein